VSPRPGAMARKDQIWNAGRLTGRVTPV